MKIFLAACLLFFTTIVSAQDLPAARKIIDTLTSATLWGRGYTKNGMSLAADYLCNEFQSAGLKPIDGHNFKQPFSYPVNTFPGKMEVSINGHQLTPGKDYIIDPDSKGQKADEQLIQKDSNTFIAPKSRIMVRIEDKLTWSVAPNTADYTGIQINKKSVINLPKTVKINIENLFIQDYKTSNICGIIKGTRQPDSLLVITAHYDHLGGMGSQTFFPGANDNGSGLALLLSLAKYYGANPPPYSIAFICFSGEEAGILGSGFFTAHPLFALNKIRFLVNLDMVGTGEKGITVVNATLHPKEFALLGQINQQKNYLSKINSRGEAAISDHYYFTQKGVPAFFMYTQGGIAAYHDVDDLSPTLPLTSFSNLFGLIKDFNTAIMN